MKKLLLTVCLLTPTVLLADDGYHLSDGSVLPFDFVRIPSFIIILYIIAAFLLSMTRLLLNYHLRRKLIERGITDAPSGNLLLDGSDSQNSAIKWGILLLAVGAGMGIDSLIAPGWLWVAIPTVLMALGFFSYSLYLKR